MTQQQVIAEAQPENSGIAAPEDNAIAEENSPLQNASDADSEGDEDEVEFPKKAVNALHRKDKKINKLRAQMRELEARLNDTSAKEPEVKEVNPDDFEKYGDYIDAKVKALVEQKTQQSQSDMQKQQLTQHKEVLKAQRDQYIIEQANEVAKTFTDLPQVWKENAQLLDALPDQVADIFYSIDNAPAAIYMLAREGKLQSLLYANPAVAAYEIVNAQNKGLEMLAAPQPRPQPRVSQAPTPITKARGSGSVKKQLTPNDDVLKSLGLKK